MKKEDIKAVVLTDWDRNDHPNCKFLPGDKVRIGWGYSSTQKSHRGKVGKIYAVTCADDGMIRGYNTHYGRAYTRYYVDLGDNNVQYYESHMLRLAEPPQQFPKL